MPEGGGLLDVGTLTGTIQMDDRLTSTMESVIRHVEGFAEKFTHRFGAITIGIGAVATAITGVAATITTLAVKGSEIADVERGFERLAGGVGNAEQVLEAMRKGVVGTMTDMELMTDANRLLQAGVKANAEDFQALTSAARTLSREGFGPMGSLMSQIDRAMMTGNAARLSRIGITVDSKKAEQDYAGALGLSVPELSKVQHQEAIRMGIIAASNKLVSQAGMQEMSLAEMVKASRVAIANWGEEFEKRVATSEHVRAAFLAIGDAINKAFGGDSRSVQDKIIDWINNFADATTHWAPIIIAEMGEIKDWIVKIYTEVLHAWDAVPDWFKNIALNAGLAGAAIYAMGGIVKSTGLEWQDTISIASNLVQIMGKSLPDAVGAIPAAFTIATTATKLWIQNAKDFGVATAAIALLREGLGKLGLGFISSGAAMTGFMAAAAPFIVAGAAIAASVTIIYQAWKLHNENVERATALQRQQVVDASNLERINAKLGTSYRTMDEASKAWFANIKENEQKLRDLNNVQTDAQKTAEEHEKKVDALVSTLQAAAHHVDLTGEAFSRLTSVEKINIDVQGKYITFLEDRIAKGRALTQAEQDYVAVAIVSHQNFIKQQEAKLSGNKVTLEYINHQKALGTSEKEIALQLGVTTEALGLYQSTLTKTNDIVKQTTESSLAFQTKIHHNNINDWLKEEENKYNETVRLLKETGRVTASELDLELKKHQQVIAAEIQGRMEQMEGTRQFYKKIAEEEKNKLDAMEQNHDSVTAAAIIRQRDRVRQSQQDLDHWAAKAEEDFDKGAKAADKVGDAVDGIGKELDKTKIKVKTLSGEMITLAEAEERHRQGGSQDVTSQNFEKSLTDITNPWFNPTGQGSNIDMVEARRLAEQGYSFAEILDIFNKRKTGGGGPVPPPHGPPIPGFGGSAPTRPTTTKPPPPTRPATTSTLPEGGSQQQGTSGGMGGDTYHITMQVNGTGEQVARDFKTRIMTEQRLRGQLPSR